MYYTLSLFIGNAHGLPEVTFTVAFMQAFRIPLPLISMHYVIVCQISAGYKSSPLSVLLYILLFVHIDSFSNYNLFTVNRSTDN